MTKKFKYQGAKMKEKLLGSKYKTQVYIRKHEHILELKNSIHSQKYVVSY